MSPREAVVAALQTEYAVVYLYGIVDAYASASRKTEIQTYTAQHRAQRDALAAVLRSDGGDVPSAAPAYDAPAPITDPVSAAKVAAALEDDCAAAYRSLLAQADGDGVRHLAVTGLSDSAVRGGRWRVALGEPPANGAFPGIRD